MIAKTLIGVAGAAAVAATASLPGYQNEEAVSVAAKGDRLAIAVSACAPDCPALATTTVPAGRWVTIERRVGEAGSVLIRVPVADIAAAEIVSEVFSGASAGGAPIESAQR
jgi:hypothetical protein